MFPMNRRVLANPIKVEYDSRGRRTVKELPNAFKARSFYTAKFKLGKNPRIVK